MPQDDHSLSENVWCLIYSDVDSGPMTFHCSTTVGYETEIDNTEKPVSCHSSPFYLSILSSFPGQISKTF